MNGEAARAGIVLIDGDLGLAQRSLISLRWWVGREMARPLRRQRWRCRSNRPSETAPRGNPGAGRPQLVLESGRKNALTGRVKSRLAVAATDAVYRPLSSGR